MKALRLLPLLFLCSGCSSLGHTSAVAFSTLPQQGMVTVGEKSFALELADTEAAKQLIGHLPLTLAMDDLSGYEKYAYLPFALPTNKEWIGNTEVGDVMLYQDNCLVLFYVSLRTTYSYTRIGRLTGAEGLSQAVGEGSVFVSFSLV